MCTCNHGKHIDFSLVSNSLHGREVRGSKVRALESAWIETISRKCRDSSSHQMPRKIKIKIKYNGRLNIPPINFVQSRRLLPNGVPNGEEGNPGLSFSVGALGNQADVAAFPWKKGLTRCPQYLDLEVFYKSEFRSDYTGNLMLYSHSYSLLFFNGAGNARHVIKVALVFHFTIIFWSSPFGRD